MIPRSYMQADQFLPKTAGSGVFVEIGSDFGFSFGLEGGEGSTEYLARLAETHQTVLHTVDIRNCENKTVNNTNIVWHTGKGSEWAQKTYPSINKRISLLYLDNYFFIQPNDLALSISEQTKKLSWNETTYNTIKGHDWPQKFTKFDDLPQWCQDEVLTEFRSHWDQMNYDTESDYKKFGLKISNQNSQLEHFKQIYYLLPWLDHESLIILDDTGMFGGVWYGKCGPGVVLLQTLGFKIKKINVRTVIMQGKENE